MKNIFLIFVFSLVINGCSNDDNQTIKDPSSNQQKTTNQSNEVVYFPDVKKIYPEAGKYTESGKEKMDVNDYRGAILDFKKSLSLIGNEKDKAVVYIIIGLCYSQLFEVDPAINYLEKGIQLSPNHPKIKEWKKDLNNLKNF